jgi:hypothetical protein
VLGPAGHAPGTTSGSAARCPTPRTCGRREGWPVARANQDLSPDVSLPS